MNEYTIADKPIDITLDITAHAQMDRSTNALWNIWNAT